MVLRSKTTAGFTELSCELLVTSDSSVHTRGCFFPLRYKRPRAGLQRLWEDSCVCPHRGGCKASASVCQVSRNSFSPGREGVWTAPAADRICFLECNWCRSQEFQCRDRPGIAALEGGLAGRAWRLGIRAAGKSYLNPEAAVLRPWS